MIISDPLNKKLLDFVSQCIFTYTLIHIKKKNPCYSFYFPYKAESSENKKKNDILGFEWSYNDNFHSSNSSPFLVKMVKLI